MLSALSKLERLGKSEWRVLFARAGQRAGGNTRACPGQECRRCPYQFTRGYGTPVEVKQAAVALYGYGHWLNAVGHVCGSCAQSVMRWVCKLR